MRPALSLASLFVLPLVRAREALRDAVDAGIHLWLDTKEKINPTPHDPTVWHRRHVRFGVRTIEGVHAEYVWRRKRPDGKWEYSKREMTEDEAEAEADSGVW
jgi:hypothetical protein